MKKAFKNFIFSVTMLLLLICCVSCSKKENVSTATLTKSTNDQTSTSATTKNTQHSASKTPTTIMDLFDGDSKIWFYVDGELSYNSVITAVFKTKNKQVTDFYYHFNPKYRPITTRGDWGFDGETPNPVTDEALTLAELEGLSDNEIMDKVCQIYGNATKNYSLLYKDRDGVYPDIQKVVSFPSVALPCAITYEGDLDNSGNKLSNENLSFINKQFTVHAGTNNCTYEGYPIRCNRFYFTSILKPTVIKDKTYIGLNGSDDIKIITKNIYSSFDKISFDDPN